MPVDFVSLLLGLSDADGRIPRGIRARARSRVHGEGRHRADIHPGICKPSQEERQVPGPHVGGFG